MDTQTQRCTHNAKTIMPSADARCKRGVLDPFSKLIDSSVRDAITFQVQRLGLPVSWCFSVVVQGRFSAGVGFQTGGRVTILLYCMIGWMALGSYCLAQVRNYGSEL